MVSINLPDNVAAHLNKIARDENRDIADVLETMIEQYEPPKKDKNVDWDLILGVSDADISDMSSHS
ncbi:MAG: ribbon-helix-helix domain-containing protein [Chloroflexi bacterium]|nr:ribbon-helix-helix domain-containing protein [Chloroflexota bacterium]MCC6897163.1 ribbon-helix-helix protein, CopG family [Anaerolineae bacterium]